MDDVDRLLEEFIEEDRAGGVADPLIYLERVRGTDRAQLETLIDEYLARAPRRPFDRVDFARSPARPVAEGLGRALGGASGTWPALLPRLRHHARLRRADVVQQLAESLGAVREVDKIARYYHAMEHGTLPAAGVSDRVLEALARVIGTTAQRLRDAGRGVGGVSPGAAGAAFARVGAPDPRYLESETLAARPASAPREPRDEIDELFTSAGRS